METSQLINFSNLEAVLEEYATSVCALYRDKLSLHDHYASGNLINNMTYIIDRGVNSIEVSLKLEDYWKYVENGTRPHWPPVSKILEWVRVKHILPSKTYNGKLPTEKQLAFLISRKISEVGTKGTQDLSMTLHDLNTAYEQKIGEAINEDLNEAMTAILLEFQMK